VPKENDMLKKFWYRLWRGVAEPALPEVWASETHAYDAGTDTLTITWRLSRTGEMGDSLPVGIHHSATADGADTDYVWEIPAGQSSIEGAYAYALGSLAVSELVFGVYDGSGYTVPGTGERPRQATVDTQRARGLTAWVSETHSYDQATRRLTCTWTLHTSQALSEPALYKVYHPATQDGRTEYWDWAMPAGKTSVGAPYGYAVDSMTVTELVFGVLAGTGYTVASPAEVRVNIAQAMGTPAPSAFRVIEDTVLGRVWFMPRAGFRSVDYEYSVNHGANWTPCPGNVVDVSTRTLAKGQLRIRHRALNGGPAGPEWSSTKAFAPVSIAYQGPVTISQGGTYTGNYRSTDPGTPAVKVTTSEPVTLQGCVISFMGDGVSAMYGTYDGNLGHALGVNVTVRDCRFLAQPITGTLNEARIAIRVGEPIHVDIQHNYLESCAGVQVRGRYRGNGTTAQTIRIKHNRAVNIDVRKSADGYSRQLWNYINLGSLQVEVPHVEVGWNHCHNHMGKHDVEDVFSLSNCRGTDASPMKVHDNCLRGASYWHYQKHGEAGYSNAYYSGGGIMVESPGASTSNCAKNINVTDNYVFDSNNYSFGCASGINIHYDRNTTASKAMADAEDFVQGRDTSQGEFTGNSSNTYFDDQYYGINQAGTTRFSATRHAVVADYRVSKGYSRIGTHYAGSTSLKVHETAPVQLASDNIDEDFINSLEREWWDKVAQGGLRIGPVALSGATT
jgi:hypothetical protein